jgi:heme exporter protein A
MLQAADLECERGGRTLFQKLSFSLGPGELLRVAGANGSGKTSLLRILCGLLSPTAGEVRWGGQPIRSLAEEYSHELVHIGHAAGLKDELTAAENLSITCTLAGSPVSPGHVGEALGRFGIPADQAVRQLSQGERRRAALARLALSGQVPLWLLDEPFAALDAAATGMVEELIARHVAAGGAVVYSAHQPSPIDGGARSVAL